MNLKNKFSKRAHAFYVSLFGEEHWLEKFHLEYHSSVVRQSCRISTEVKYGYSGLI